VDRKIYIILVITLSLSAQGAKLTGLVEAQEVAGQIGETQAKIKQLESEIASTEKELTKTEREKNTLSNAVKSLDLTKKKLEAETKITENKVALTSSSIESLSEQIIAHTQEIDKRVGDIAIVLRNIAGALDATPTEIFLSDSSISEKLDSMYTLERLQNRVRIDLEELKAVRVKLISDKQELEEAREKLFALRSELGDKQKLAIQNIESKSKLLADTKNKESSYRTLLDQKIAQKAAFEQELRNFETKLKGIDVSKLPTGGTGILSWPLASVLVTQTFGDTEFSRSSAGAIYRGNGHNGIDLRASVGTAVYSAGGGKVAGTGNTDLGCPGGSYGKWILIDHGNGLSTLYAHLSLQRVSTGEDVERGGLIGYSGNTGYSTGPHLHFTVYASEGVKITKLIRADGSVSKCAEMPVSPLNGYLNPLLYL